MIKVTLHKNSIYNGKECKTVCFSCDNHMATHDVTFQSPINKQRIPLCQECLMVLFVECRTVEAVEEA